MDKEAALWATAKGVRQGELPARVARLENLAWALGWGLLLTAGGLVAMTIAVVVSVWNVSRVLGGGQ